MGLKSILRAITLELRRELEGKYDAQGTWQPGDLERRLAAIGVRRNRPPVPVDELSLSADDREARKVVEAFLQIRAEADQGREAAIADFVREAAYSWANRLLALRCMEARGLIDEVVLQKHAYGGRSLQHQRVARKEPERCSGEDEGLLAVLFDEFARRATELPLLFDPKASEVALRPSIAVLKRSIALLSGTLAAKGQDAATDEVFTAPDALGWTYQYWNTEEKDRVFEKVRTRKGSKIEGSEIVPATCIYTEPYMVKFLVQNSLGAIWMGMHPDSRLSEKWEYYVRDADRAPVSKKAVSEITFLDPACGSGHFLIEAFELFYAMYLEEGTVTDPAKICAAILERNLYGIDIDERAVQIAALALVMKAKEKAPDFVPCHVNLVATNIRLPAGKDHLEAFLRKHPEDAPLKPALLAIFEGLAHADELGSLLQIEEPVDRELRHLRDQQLERERKAAAGTLFGPRGEGDWVTWKHDVIERLRQHFSVESGAPDLGTAFFGEAASKGLSLVDVLARRYDVVAANPPYMGSKNMGAVAKRHLERHFFAGKRDLYAAFVLRCRELATDAGRVAMVTQQSWMFLRSYRALRTDTLLSESTIEALAHFGAKAFGDGPQGFDFGFL
jgi:SAM-dependent methyltransferase